LGKGYVNVNTQDDLDLAKNMLKKDLPRVLIVHTQMKFLGGAELLIVELANWLTKKGIKNDILALSKSKEVQDRLINTEIIIPKHHINLEPPGFKNPKEIIDFIKIYRKEIKNIANNYDVINFHNFPVTWTLFPRKKPCVWMLNEPPNLWSKPNAGWKLKFMNKIRNYLDKIIINNSVDIICVADEFNHKRTLERYGRNSKIVFYGVNYDFFSKGKPNKAIQKWSLKNKFVIVQSGVLNEPKNQLESIKILNKIKNEIPNVLLVLAGKWDEDYKKKLDEYVKQNNIEKYVLFTGNLGREELRDLYSACHMGLFPVGEQGGWLAPFELLCSGKPLVVSKEIGVGSIIRKFNLGLSTNEYDKAVLDIYKNYNNYSKSSKEIKEFIKNNFGWNIFTDKLIRAFKGAWKSHTQDITYIH
jgi:glycosyltransferase involved in cell wall biosynthesis